MVTARARACSKPRPASTLMTSRSRTSGSFLRIANWRSSMTRLSQASGPTTPARGDARRNWRTDRGAATDVYFHTTYHRIGTATTERTWKTRNRSVSSGCPRPASTSFWSAPSRRTCREEAARASAATKTAVGSRTRVDERLRQLGVARVGGRLVVGQAGPGGSYADPLVGLEDGGVGQEVTVTKTAMTIKGSMSDLDLHDVAASRPCRPAASTDAAVEQDLPERRCGEEDPGRSGSCRR